MPPSFETHNAAKPLRIRFTECLLHLGFALTGVGTVLLGCVLPQVSAQWHLQDKTAGLLLLIQFATSASGALLVRRNLLKTLARGYALFAVGGMGIFLAQHISFLLYGLAFGVLGLGLGMAMTSTNMLISRRYPERRGAALAILNFSWSAGAVACPLIIARVLGHTSSGSMFGLLGLLVVPFALTPLALSSPAFDAPATIKPATTGLVEARLIANSALLAFLYVGIESTIGNWMSTFATRAASWSVMSNSMAVAAFWAALLLGRAMTPAILTVLRERRLYILSLTLVAGGAGILLAAHSARMILAGAVVSGFALAPVFPLILSLFLNEAGESPNAGWVFAVAGLGGAVLSWLAGVVSTSSGSVRNALLVPVAAAGFMLFLAGRPSGRDTRIMASNQS